VSIILLGPWTNLARALTMERRIADNLGTLYVSGGDFDGRPIKNSFYPWINAKTNGASWNIFSDPLAVQRVLLLDLPVIMMTSEAQGYLPVDLTNVENYAATYNVSPFLVKLVTQLARCCNEPQSDVDYWDPSAAVLMYQLAASKPTTICTRWEEENAFVDLFNGGGFGRTFDKTLGTPVRVCRNASIALFEEEYWSVMEGESTCPPVDTKDYSKTPTAAYVEKQVLELQSQITDLQTQLNNLKKKCGKKAN